MLSDLPRQPAAPAAATTTEAPPDWSAQKDDIFCPLCDYNLRGLIEPRCPACGYRFAWSDLLDAHRRIHPWLFEHHPESNIRSYLATVRAVQRPSKFWPTLHPAQPSRPGRMLAFWLVGVVLFMISFAICSISLHGLAWYPGNLSGSDWEYTPIAEFLQEFLAAAVRYATSRQLVHNQAWCVVLVIGWPILNFTILLIMQSTMRRLRIRPHHIARSVC